MFTATTILAVKKDGHTAVAGDGQVTMGSAVVMKNTARKVRRLYHGKVIAGFAGSVADAFALFDKFEGKLSDCNGEVIEPDDGILAIGSGGNYALAAARALCSVSDLSAREIAERSLHVAADICVYTNHNVIVEEIG